MELIVYHYIVYLNGNCCWFCGQFERNTYFKAVSLDYRPSRRSLVTRLTMLILFDALYAALIVAFSQNEAHSSRDVMRLVRHLITLLLLGFFIFQPYINSDSFQPV
ncbi:MAG TPA: hypothetical protein PLV53_11440 [Anaerolineaceae bacterium]|nr:hypothetical protein [Anaerolineaceae bacterium]